MRNTLVSRIQAQDPLGINVVEASAPDWRPQAIVGMVIMLNVVSLKVSTPGPWDSESFTLGLMGSVSMVLLYISWYRITFKRRGLIPWVDLWAEPKKSANLVLLSSVVILSIAWFTGNNMQDILPRPTGLVLSLVGFLMLAQSLYVLLSVGPLSED
tara:strand:+ start:3289 stop:3756 length:468 start_codon:yes stop_codon:yes gene_type:complete